MKTRSLHAHQGPATWLVLFVLAAAWALAPARGAETNAPPAKTAPSAPPAATNAPPDKPPSTDQPDKTDESAAADKVEKSDKSDRDAAYRQIERLTEVLLLIRKHYVEDKSYEEIVTGALRGMMGSIDPYSGFLDAKAYDDIQTETTGRYSGIGVEIGVREGVLTVIAPIEDTPGYRAGLQSGDKIMEIDGQKTLNMTQKEAVDKLRGPAGKAVTLQVVRNGEHAPRRIELVREEIKVSSVKGARMLSDRIGYVRITQFSQPTAEYLRQALDKLKKDGMTALVLDLRGNPGGLLRSAVEVSAEFLPAGALVVATRSRKGTESELRTPTRGTRPAVDLPTAVLVNPWSASASEIVAGALQDHKRAIVVGDNTFGKGSVQSVIPLRTDTRSAVRLTTARYHTPNGREIGEKGIEPDIRVPVAAAEWRRIQMKRSQDENPDAYSQDAKEEYADVVDRQLERAMDLLQGIRVLQARAQPKP
jgi:carboxyl-terminal processing protease